ncbi:PstS family phosphate ABC transporter substrate-binding protein [Volucribacter amazonae]|uniref:PBP domain-containing protein n=1 Tax=Volucribacter amazonae TaxID=256731 RepID=A0A9X4SR87_9PAST|nr:substrate-binding domain-containing protein [Volucribacter amazonae]MDG6896336.1 hypothetical protein [Volucribacter amazonae]
MIRILFLILGAIAVVVIAFFLWLSLVFAGYKFSGFLPIMAIISYFATYYFYTHSYQLKKNTFKVIIGLFVSSIVSYLGYIGYVNYVRAIPTVTEFSRHDYEPFNENNKLAKLAQKSTLQLSKENLPRLDGSTALFPVYAAFVNATYPKLVLIDLWRQVRQSKTGQAYNNLLEGEVDIIFVPAPSKHHLKQAQEKGLSFNLLPIGREAFVFFVHKKNPVENLSIQNIIDIYSGKITNWQPLNGRNKKIRAFQRPENSGSQTALQRIMQGTELMPAPKEDVPTNMGGIISQVAHYRNYENAIGFSFLLYATEMVTNEQIKLLSIDGVMPNKTNIANNHYPFTYDFYAVTIAGRETEQVLALLQWIKSEQGKELIQKTGYVVTD